jgi:hypothetical protein
VGGVSSRGGALIDGELQQMAEARDGFIDSARGWQYEKRSADAGAKSRTTCLMKSFMLI